MGLLQKFNIVYIDRPTVYLEIFTNIDIWNQLFEARFIRPTVDSLDYKTTISIHWTSKLKYFNLKRIITCVTSYIIM